MYGKTSKIIIKRKMIYIHNKIIKQKQTIREETRERPILEYKKENWIFLKRNSGKKNRFN